MNRDVDFRIGTISNKKKQERKTNGMTTSWNKMLRKKKYENDEEQTAYCTSFVLFWSLDVFFLSSSFPSAPYRHLYCTVAVCKHSSEKWVFLWFIWYWVCAGFIPFCCFRTSSKLFFFFFGKSQIEGLLKFWHYSSFRFQWICDIYACFPNTIVNFPFTFWFTVP